MERGKLASQTGHATRISLLKFLQQNPSRLDEFVELGSCGSIVVLKAKNLGLLEAAQAQAEASGLPTHAFVDRDHVIPGTAFDGSPVKTVLAIGPAPRDAMRAITRKFQCA